MMAEIKKNTTEGVLEKFECNFSTTQFVQRIFSNAAVLNTQKNYYEYHYATACGIQNIHFGGTLEDWIKVKKKTEGLL